MRYSVNGETFWDNNNGGNYQVDTVRPNTVGGNVVLNKSVARRGLQAGGGFTFVTSWVEGEIYVKNLSFNKRVGIRLSANGWATFQGTDASFSGVVPVAAGLSQVELWKFKTPELNLDPISSVFAFAIFVVKAAAAAVRAEAPRSDAQLGLSQCRVLRRPLRVAATTRER